MSRNGMERAQDRRPEDVVGPVVEATPEAVAYIREHGGRLNVRPDRSHYCGGVTTVLIASTEPPADLRGYRVLRGDGVAVLLHLGFRDLPERLVIKMQGIIRRRPGAYWNGCAFVL